MGLFRFSESAAQKAISPRNVRSEACISGRTLNRRATVIDLLDGVLSQIFSQHKIIAGDISSSALFFVKEKEGIVWKQLNPVKDDTDTEFAIRQAIRLGTEEITILGGTGSRLDHVLGNVSLLGIGLSEQVQMQIVDEHNRIRMIDKAIRIKKEELKLISSSIFIYYVQHYKHKYA